MESHLITLHAIEQKRLGRSCMYLPQASHEPAQKDLVDGFASFAWGRGFRCTAFSPLILYVCNATEVYLLCNQRSNQIGKFYFIWKEEKRGIQIKACNNRQITTSRVIKWLQKYLNIIIYSFFTRCQKKVHFLTPVIISDIQQVRSA